MLRSRTRALRRKNVHLQSCWFGVHRLAKCLVSRHRRSWTGVLFRPRVAAIFKYDSLNRINHSILGHSNISCRALLVESGNPFCPSAAHCSVSNTRFLSGSMLLWQNLQYSGKGEFSDISYIFSSALNSRGHHSFLSFSTEFAASLLGMVQLCHPERCYMQVTR